MSPVTKAAKQDPQSSLRRYFRSAIDDFRPFIDFMHNISPECMHAFWGLRKSTWYTLGRRLYLHQKYELTHDKQTPDHNLYCVAISLSTCFYLPQTRSTCRTRFSYSANFMTPCSASVLWPISMLLAYCGLSLCGSIRSLLKQRKSCDLPTLKKRCPSRLTCQDRSKGLDTGSFYWRIAGHVAFSDLCRQTGFPRLCCVTSRPTLIGQLSQPLLLSPRILSPQQIAVLTSG